MENKKIVILAGQGITSNIVYNSIKKDFNIEAIIFEKQVSRKTLLKKRIKKLGLWKVLGQVVFQVLVMNWLELTSKIRKAQILKQNGLDDSLPPVAKTFFVESVNDNATVKILQKLNPDLVVVNGTRIISEKILKSLSVPFINTHAGITPKYRNVHGAYWAIVNNDMENCGVTVHLVDKGIDTGSIIYQETIEIIEKDNFVTYPILQIAVGVGCLKKAINDIFEGSLIIKKRKSESALWYHPTLGQYLYHRIFHHIK